MKYECIPVSEINLSPLPVTLLLFVPLHADLTPLQCCIEHSGSILATFYSWCNNPEFAFS